MGTCINAEPEMVARHTNKLCTTLVSDSQNSQKNSLLVKNSSSIKLIMTEIYQYFSSKLSHIDNTSLDLLRNTCTVLVTDSSCLIKSNQVAIDIREEDQILPYLYKLPLDLGPYKDFFIRLGATKRITLEQYANILKRIFLDMNDQELNPNLKNITCRALAGLFMTIDCENPPALPTELFIPCTDGKLHMSSEVVIEDNYWLRRIPNFTRPIFIDMIKFGYQQDKCISLFKKLPAQYQPKLLSSIILEKLDPNCENAESSLANDMCARLRSQDFRNCFEQLLLHCCQTTASQQKDIHVREIVGKLSCIEFIGKFELKTYLMLENKRLENSEVKKFFFIDDGNFKIHIDADFSGETFFHDAVANVINKIAGNMLHGLAFCVLSRILQCPLYIMNTKLNEYGIKESRSDHESFIPPLGSYVPCRYFDLLSQDVFAFSPEQIVALEIEDPLESGNEGEPIYILAEIVEKIDSGSCDIKAEYRVKISGTEERTVDVSVLYAFMTPRKSDNTEFLSMVLYAGPKNDTASTNKPDERQPDLKEIITEIKRLLKEAWTMSVEQRNRFIKRLYLRWHPDKNPDKIELSTEVFKILQILIGKLEKGQGIDDYNVDRNDASTPEESNDFDFKNFYGFNSSNFRDYMGERARHYHDYSEHFRGRSGRSDRNSYRDYFRGFTTEPNPQPHEAKRWMRQAQCDLESAMKEENFDWKCLKSYQVIYFSFIIT